MRTPQRIHGLALQNGQHICPSIDSRHQLSTPRPTMHLVKLAPLALLTSLVAVSPIRCDTSKYITVDTSSGPITGRLANNSTSVVEYLGIPYAKPPVEDLRFAPPRRFNSTTPYEAKSFGYNRPLSPSKAVDYPGKTAQAQDIISYFASAAGTPQSEDCLTLNIWPNGGYCQFCSGQQACSSVLL
jgi:cholinesterase